MKKDPLQREATAYERIGLAPGEIDPGAFPAIPLVADDTADAVAVGEELRDPVRRALVDLFLYQDRYLDDLAFDDPLETLGETPARRRVAERWRAIERRGFPMPAATHSIAVLSYWEARGSGRNGPDLPTPPDVTARLWEAALCRFAALCASEAFWTEWGVVTGNRGAADGGAAALERHLADELEAMAALRVENGDIPGEARVREHIALFRSELEAARALPALKVLSGRGLSPAAIAAGPRLLAEVGLLEKVQAAVGELRPDLLPRFSPIALIDRLVEEREYEGALGAIERLEPEAREAPDVRRLEARVLLELGRGDLEAGRIDDAIARWHRAIALAEVRSAVAVPISGAVLGAAKLLHSREEHDEAIALLQKALPLGERELVGVPLAHFLLERAEARMARATDGADDETAIAELRGAVADLEEAVTLDPTNGETRDRRNEAEDQLRSLLASAGPEPVEPGPVDRVAAAPAGEPGSAAENRPQAEQSRVSALGALGIALWVGVGLLALVAYPLMMPQRLGGVGTLIALGVAVGWIAANAVGYMLLR